MANSGAEWSAAELAAAVEAYLQMLRLEQLGETFNKAGIRRMLLAGPVSGRTTTEQRMQNISAVMEGLGLPTVTGYKPLSNVGPAAAAQLRRLVQEFTSPTAAPMPLRPPVDPKGKGPRKLPPTGYWMLVANPRRWDPDQWRHEGRSELLYKISEHNREEVQAGDLAVLRVGATRLRPASVLAVLECLGSPKLQSDDDLVAYADEADAAALAWRAPFRILGNDFIGPIPVGDLPEADDFSALKHALQTSTIPISRTAFAEIFRRSGLDPTATRMEISAQTAKGATQLETTGAHLDPKARERVSRFIERGKIGEEIKRQREGRCQLCEALGQAPVAFWKSDGSPYSEAHHVYPVSELRAGSLASSNIMVLCPNHHRQVHYGDFQVIEHRNASWVVRLGAQRLEIARTQPVA